MKKPMTIGNKKYFKLIHKKCERCGKVIKGTDYKQVDYNYNVHVLWCDDEAESKVDKKLP